jgi:hypothetical protein
MTLEKPPRGKPVKRKFIMELIGKILQQRLQPTYLKLAAQSSLKLVPAVP